MAESFFQRWSRRKTQNNEPAGRDGDDMAGSSTAATAPAGTGASVPSLRDVAALQPGSDYSAFMAQGVDKSVRRAALKKLFSDPHFNTMDGLDIYIGDYTKPSPLPAAMLAALRHSQSTLSPRPLYAQPEAVEEEAAEPQREADLVRDEVPPDADQADDAGIALAEDAPEHDKTDDDASSGNPA